MNDFYSYSLRQYVPLSNAAEDALTAIHCLERCMRQLTDNHPGSPMNVEQMNAWNLGAAVFIERACLTGRFILGAERSPNSVAQECKLQDIFNEVVSQ